MFSLVGEAVCHARLTEPPARTTAWRFGFGTPVNYNDHETNCGGFSRQWTRNGGRCGPCGDPWDRARPREGEAGGRYGRGVVVRRYTEAATLAVRVDVTANHRGHFAFALCDRATAEDDACFRRHPLVVADTGAARWPVARGTGTHAVRVQLPRNVTCGACVLQWRYVAGNNWGACPGGGGAVGCGPQEEFRACADISIARAGDSAHPAAAGSGGHALGQQTWLRPSVSTWSSSWWPWSRSRTRGTGHRTQTRGTGHRTQTRGTGYRTETEHGYSYFLSSLVRRPGAGSVATRELQLNLTSADTGTFAAETLVTRYSAACRLLATIILSHLYSVLSSWF